MEIPFGWEGQPKGMLQTLWEHGWIDENNLGRYTVSGKKRHLVSSIQSSAWSIYFDHAETLMRRRNHCCKPKAGHLM
jgi:hypothetical protein